MSQKTAITAEKAPAALGPYSVAIRSGETLYCSGQLGMDPETGDIVPGCAGCQTRQVLTNVSAVLEAAGMTLDNVVKTTVFLSDMGNFSKMNDVYAEFFSQPFPARSTVAVKALPKDAMVEIEVVAVER
jgi:2-iminobutanoate/2-iminopropanoate deaminase